MKGFCRRLLMTGAMTFAAWGAAAQQPIKTAGVVELSGAGAIYVVKAVAEKLGTASRP